MYHFSKPGVPGLPIIRVSLVKVVLNGGMAFPEISKDYYIPYRPRMTIRQVLAATGAVGFGYLGQIVSMGGITIDGGVSLRMTIGGRTFPPAAIDLPATSGDIIALYLRPIPVPDAY